MASINARIARALAVRPAAGRGHPSGRMTGRAVGRGQDTNRRRKYSYCHGYDNHNGSVCKVMLSDRVYYTAPYMSAVSHTRLEGGCVNRL